MADTTEKDRKTPLSLTRPGKLELKKTVEAGQVRQSFSHGRSKVVTVEVRKKRTFGPGSAGAPEPSQPPETVEAQSQEAAAPASVERAPTATQAPGAAASPRMPQGRRLTEAEKAHRLRVLQEARHADEEARRRADEEARRRADEEARRAEEESRRRAEEEARRAEEEARRAEEARANEGKTTVEGAEEEKAKAEQPPIAAAQPAAAQPTRPSAPEAPRPVPGKARVEEEEEEERPRRPGLRPGPAKKLGPSPAKGADAQRRRGKLTLTAALDDGGERMRSLASVKRHRERERQRQMQNRMESQKIVREVTIPDTITVQELANRVALRGADVIKQLMRMGVMATINQVIDADTAELVVTELGHTPKRVSESDVELGLRGEVDAPELLKSRPPVVTVMGHVDHGKTSLLDALRATDVAGGEAGGITQHIGAYQVTLKSGQKITFIDTPGHEAFTAMRARGAKVTDIVVLVVAADDGIMPQTIEAIRHAKAANVPIVVAVNKIDKPDANPQKVRTELLNHEVQLEEFGGEVLSVDVSAKARTNLDKLEEAILLQAEILDLKANPDRAAEGIVVEAKLERGRGSVATVLVQRGTLKVGDVFVTGSEWGRVRALVDDRGNPRDSAGPGEPIEILGLNGTPSAGDDFVVVDTEARARSIADFRQRKDREARAVAGARGTLEQMFSKIAAGETKELPVIIKADVQGSIEAIAGTIQKIGTEEVSVRVLHTAVGGINESDVTLANASKALIIGFNVRANPQAREMARRDGVDIRYYSIIYDVADDLKKMVAGMLSPVLRERFLGYAEIREVFNITKVGKVAGCRVTEGMVKRGAKVRLLRDNVVIHEGALSTLKRFKDDVREVKEGFECGMSFENYNDIQPGDVIECYEVEQVAPEL